MIVLLQLMSVLELNIDISEVFLMNDAQIRYYIEMERKKGTTTDELIFILSDNGIPIYEISNYLDISVKHVEMVLSDG